MDWLVLQMTAVGVAAWGGMLDEWLTRHTWKDARYFLLLFALISLPVTIVGILFQPFIWQAAVVGLASGLCFCGALLLYYRAAALETAANLSLPGRFIAMLSLPINAGILGESISGYQMMGFILLLGSSWTLIAGHREGRVQLSKAFWLMLGVEVLYLLQDLIKIILTVQYDAWTMLTWERAGIVLGTFIALIYPPRAPMLASAIRRPLRETVILAGRPLIHLLMTLLSGLAVQQAPSPIALVVLWGTYPFFVLALTRLLHGSQALPHFRRHEGWLALAIVLVGMVLATM